jgi:hypothetical protein
VQVAGRAVAGKQVLYSIFSQILVRELEVGMYDAISRDAVSLLVCRRSEAKHVGEFRFSSLLEFMHLPTNPEHKLLHFPCSYCDVTGIRITGFPKLSVSGGRCAFSPLPLHTDRPKTLVYRDLISRHPGRYVSVHNETGEGPC